MPGMYGGGLMPSTLGMPQQQQQSSLTANSSSNQKHDIFVGNLAFNTTEEQLMQAFSEIGRVLNVRMVTDQETGKPRGFAFVEFEDPQVALSAIRNMTDYELNGRRLRVNFSNSSHLEVLASKLGMDLSSHPTQKPATGASTTSSSTKAHMGGGGAGGTGGGAAKGGGAATGTDAVADALKSLSKSEMYDVVAKLKEIADRDPDEARRVISGHPQLPEALLFIMSKLDMVKTPLAATTTMAEINNTMMMMPTTAVVRPVATNHVGMPATTVVGSTAAAPVRTDPRARVDPRARAAAAVDPRPPPSQPPQQQQQQQQPPPRVADPRARAAAAAAAPPPPPPPPPRLGVIPQQQQQQLAPPVTTTTYGQPPPQHPPALAHLDPSLVQQVMSLTPQQIQLLPPDKQQSILQLRQQIQGSGMQ